MSTRRYANLAKRVWTAPDGRELQYLERRLLPAASAFGTTRPHVVRPGERSDTIAAVELGDPELAWLLADANDAMRPSELESPESVLAIPAPDGAALRVNGR
jgi:hypothetical protein